MKHYDGIALFSGGLDSILAARLVMDQGLAIKCLHFFSPFFGHPGRIAHWEKEYGLDIDPVDVSAEFVELLRRGPAHGFGSAMNPCVDCKIVMISRARELMETYGAKFIVSPGLNPTTVKYCQEIGVPVCPGTANPSDIELALSLGLKSVKFFPAEAAGGVKMIKNLLGAFRFTGVKFMPTGGVNPQNVKEYLAVPEIVACGGTWIVPKDALAADDWAAIEKLAAEAAAIAKAR